MVVHTNKMYSKIASSTHLVTIGCVSLRLAAYHHELSSCEDIIIVRDKSYACTVFVDKIERQ